MGIGALFTRKQRRVQELLEQYMDQWAACVQAFREAWGTFLSEGVSESFDFKVAQTHKHESRADDTRRTIELELYGKALLPESRGDMLGLLETVDRLLTEAEWVLYELQLQQIVLPANLKGEFRQLVDTVVACCEALDGAIRVLFIGDGDPKGVRGLIDKIDYHESESDHLERRLIREIFQLECSTGDKLLLKGIVLLMARVTDRAENVGDRITLTSVKRRV